MIRREVLVAPGDVFNTVRVETTKKRLDNLGYFTKVETFPDDTDIAGRKDLTILVEEKRTGSLNFGGGFSTIDQLVGFVELTQGNFDITNWPALLVADRSFDSACNTAPSERISFCRLTEPYFLDRRLSVSGQLSFIRGRLFELGI